MQLEQLGPYRLGRQLGRGGMGTVYEGVHTESGEPAAIKILSMHLAQEEGFRERFEAEIETLKKLNHPNIVRLLGWGEQDAYVFYGMELVSGRSLDEELRAGRRFEWREVTQIGVKMCRALKHAHDHGVIHRDIKPANLLLSTDGELKLSDFGIAKLFGSTGMTSTGGVLGTAEYMAPEQADGRPVTYRSDLYSLGGVLYTLLARRPPFVARTIVEMLQLQRFAQPDPVRRYAGDVPDELEAIVLQLLEKDPEKRVRSALVLGRRLEAMEHGLLSRQSRQQQLAKTVGGVRSPIAPNQTHPDHLDEVGVTRTAPDFSVKSPVDGHSSIQDGSSKSAVEETAFSQSAVPAAAPSASSGAATPSRVRFTTLEEEQREERKRNRDESPLVSLQIWLLAAAMVVLGLGAWWMLQPDPADKIYARIIARAEDEQPERLVEAEDDIDQFLRYYPRDKRVRELENYLGDIQLHQAERQLERYAKRGAKDKALSPVQRIYVEAIQTSQNEPEEAIAKLESLVALYDDQQGMPDGTRLCVALAERKLLQLRRQIQDYSTAHLSVLEDRLDRADELQKQRLHHESQGIWKATIELYADKPWARKAVKRARERLVESEKTIDQAPSPARKGSG